MNGARNRPSAVLALLLLAAPLVAQQREVELAWLRNAATVEQGSAGHVLTGRNVAAAGDVNGDGRDDVLFAGWETGLFVPPGTVYLVYGQPYFGLPQSEGLASADVVILGAGDGGLAGRGLGGGVDVNGDGFDDVLVGEERWNGVDTQSGRVYVVFGGPSLPAVIDLATFPSAAGMVIEGAGFGHLTGRSVAGAGDFDDDGLDDLIVGAVGANTNRGRAYVIFGSTSLPQTFPLAGLPGAGALVLEGVAANDICGDSVSRAGDVNGDGIDDVIVGAPQADPFGKAQAGQAYVVYGTPTPPNSLNLASLGSAGVTLHGAAPGDLFGSDVSGGGDVDADGFDDVVVGARSADVTGTNEEGKAYLVYGGAALPASINTPTLGAAGVVLLGDAPGDGAGLSVALGGDVNRDGFDDVLVGAQSADPNGNNSGAAYLLHGGSALPSSLSLGALSFRGVQLNGVAADDLAGCAVDFVRDVNDDGFDDYVVGAYRADVPGTTDAGRSWIVQGACQLLNAAGSTAEGDTFTLTAHGPPNRLSTFFISFSLLPAPVETGVGPWWMANPLPLTLLILPFDGDGQWSVPVTVPTGLGLSGTTLYWQVYIDPSPPFCDLSQVLATAIP